MAEQQQAAGLAPAANFGSFTAFITYRRGDDVPERHADPTTEWRADGHAYRYGMTLCGQYGVPMPPRCRKCAGWIAFEGVPVADPEPEFSMEVPD